jgi:hypothetical protein
MKTFQDIYEDVQRISKNSDTTQLTYFKRWINEGYHNALGKIGRWFLDETDGTTLDTVDGTQFYNLPVHFLRMKTVIVTISDIKYVLEEVPSQQEWDDLNALQTTESDIPTHFFIRANAGRFQLGLFPVPATSGYDITMVFERREKDMSAANYTTGTVTVTNADATVTGATTAFTKFMEGRMFQTSTDLNWYKIITFTSTTVLELATPFEGTTAAGASFVIGEVPLIPEDFQTIPRDYALLMWFSQEKDTDGIALYKNLYENGIKELQSAWGARSTNNVLGSRTRRRYVHPHRPLTMTM